MQLIKRASYLLSAFILTGLLAGCFSYHREVSDTTTPAVTAPPLSSTTTTTTTNDNGTVERHSTSTYSTP